jgi:hypothetical protein
LISRRRLPTPGGIESQTGPNCSGTGSQKKKARKAPGQVECLCRPLLLQIALYTEEGSRSVHLKNIFSAEAVAMTTASGENSRLRRMPTL